jgi:hypothetical protein
MPTASRYFPPLVLNAGFIMAETDSYEIKKNWQFIRMPRGLGYYLIPIPTYLRGEEPTIAVLYTKKNRNEKSIFIS